MILKYEPSSEPLRIAWGRGKGLGVGGGAVLDVWYRFQGLRNRLTRV